MSLSFNKMPDIEISIGFMHFTETIRFLSFLSIKTNILRLILQYRHPSGTFFDELQWFLTQFQRNLHNWDIYCASWGSIELVVEVSELR
jgi:hypothetical protein